jgi:hypothetical protein
MKEQVKMKWIGTLDFRHFDGEGNLLYEELGVENALLDEGEQMVLDVFLRGATAVSSFYLGLCNSTPGETDTLNTLSNEASGNGYARIAIEHSNVGWPTLALDSGDFMATSKTVSFLATSNSIGPVTSAFLCTSSDNTGKLIATAALSTTRTLANTDTLQVTYRVKLA